MLETLIKDLRRKPFERDISDFVISFKHDAPHVSAGVSHGIDFIVDVNKKSGCKEEFNYNIYRYFVHYCDIHTDDLTDNDVKDIVERNYKKIEERFPERMVRREDNKLVIDGGFLYIPRLNAYVGKHTIVADDRKREAARLIDFKASDDGHLTHINWHEAKKIVENLGSRMLKPAEFWVFYDYIREKDILCDTLGKRCGGEWLDALVSPDEMTPSEDGVFNIGDINRETGLPNRLDGFECLYVSPKSDLSTVSFHYKDSPRPLFDLSLSPEYKDYKLGVREVLDAPKVDVDGKGEKQLELW